MVVFKVGQTQKFKICMLYIVMKIRIPRDPQDRGPNRRTRHCLVGGRLLCHGSHFSSSFRMDSSSRNLRCSRSSAVDHLEWGHRPTGELAHEFMAKCSQCFGHNAFGGRFIHHQITAMRRVLLSLSQILHAHTAPAGHNPWCQPL